MGYYTGAVRTGLIQGLRPANERRHYFVTTYLIGWEQALNQPCRTSRPAGNGQLRFSIEYPYSSSEYLWYSLENLHMKCRWLVYAVT